MKSLPVVGSTITINCQYYTGPASFTGVVINLANIVDLKILKGSTTNIRKFKVTGSKGDYIVTLSGKHYSCSCIGFKYHSKCKHITKVKDKIAQ